jgi:hypothetical protein
MDNSPCIDNASFRGYNGSAMNCPHCQKEISESGFIYCPHCGKQLRHTKQKIISLRKGGLLAFIVWASLTAIAFIADAIDGYSYSSRLSPYSSGPIQMRGELYSWALQVTGILALAILVIFSVWAIYTRVKFHEP